MRKIGFFNIGRLGLVRTWQVETNINEIIEKWIPKHMVFWYDMAKPVDVYAENFNDWTKFTGAKYTVTNKSVNITNFDAVNNACIYIAKSKKFNGITITVDGLLDGQEIAWGYNNNPLVRMPKNGTYTLEPIDSVTGNIGFRSINIVGACNITITQLPIRSSVPTNEILKSNPYLQDFSGNNRPLKLNNFLFAAMSGVGGYTLNAKSYHNRSNIMVGTFGDYSIEITAKVTDILGIVWTKNGVGDSNSVAVGETLTRPAFTITVEGMPDDLKWGMYESGGTDKGNGTFEIPAYTYTNNTETVVTKFVGLTFSQNTFDNVDIKFTFQPLYPNALVTDGVDDYGVVENLQQGVKMLFYTCNPFSLNKIFYDQTKQGWRKFNIYNQADKIAYNERNENGVTYIDGNLNSLLLANDLVNKKQIITIVNEGSDANNTISPIYFSVNQHNGYFANLAFYNSIGFDSVPTKQNDGFTEQDLIDYYIPKSIVTITVVDVNGAPIENATVTIEGLQYNTLSDGTVKVVGIANSTMSISVTKDGYMPYSNNEWKFANSRIILEVINNIIIMEDGNNILLENNNLILTED
jgi:hypothetical protein